MSVSPEDFSAPKTVDFRVLGTGLTDPSVVPAFHQAVTDLFARYHALSLSVTVDGRELQPSQAAINPENERLQQWLDESIGEDFHYADWTTRTFNLLKRSDLKTYRAILLYGAARIYDLRGSGSRVLDEIRTKVEQNHFGVELEVKPSLGYAATLCGDLAQLPLHFAFGGRPDISVADFLEFTDDEVGLKFIYGYPERVWDRAQSEWVFNRPVSEVDARQYAREIKDMRRRARAAAKAFRQFREG